MVSTLKDFRYPALQPGQALLTIPRQRWDAAAPDTRELVQAATVREHTDRMAHRVVLAAADVPVVLDALYPQVSAQEVTHGAV